MKTKLLFAVLLSLLVGGGVGWFAARRWPAQSAAGPELGGRKILYYQSAMHPWIKSDRPGHCTICGMKLTPVYEGEKGFDVEPGIVTLSSNSITVLNVQAVPVRRQPLRRTLRVAGTIDDDDTKHRYVSAYLDGRIDKLFVNYVGAEVVQGQPLATFYSATLLSAEREYVALQNKRLARQTEQRTPEDDRLLAAAKQRLKRLGLTDEQISGLAHKPETALHTEILAPVSGTVVERFAYEGQYVKEGDKLFAIADFSTMWFQFDAYERDLAWIKPGQLVEITTPAIPGKTFTAPIVFIDPNLKEMTRSAKVRVEMPNPIAEGAGRPRRELFHKLYAEGSVQGEAPETLAVPRGAVLATGSKPVAYVDKGGGAYEQRRIKLGRAGDDLWEVLEGLAENERVVTSGNLLLDAQAQLNQDTAAAPDHGETDSPQPLVSPSTTATPRALPPLSETQVKVVGEFLALADALAAALAGDNLAQFNKLTGETHAAVSELGSVFASDNPWVARVRAIEAAGHLNSAPSLTAARKQFHPLSLAVVDLAQDLRQRQSQFKSVRIFRCPMTKDAFPGAPRTADWMQLQPPVKNPYFGAEMLDCGSEVKP